ncbi:MAG TPA: hypothetical protein DFH97_05555 [Clostridiales bacterium]|nr:hypothetical protein [Clostridiales bacterium]
MAGSKRPAYAVALGGLLAALAVVIMGLGTLIPIATYVCPMACIVLTQVVLKICGRRIAWAWYGAVAILSCLLSPDKEAAAVFVFLGFYPIVKPRLEKLKYPRLGKTVYFNVAILVMYWLLISVLGLAALAEEYRQTGRLLLIVQLILGNGIFFLLDRVLDRKFRRK